MVWLARWAILFWHSANCLESWIWLPLPLGALSQGSGHITFLVSVELIVVVSTSDDCIFIFIFILSKDSSTGVFTFIVTSSGFFAFIITSGGVDCGGVAGRITFIILNGAECIEDLAVVHKHLVEGGVGVNKLVNDQGNLPCK